MECYGDLPIEICLLKIYLCFKKYQLRCHNKNIFISQNFCFNEKLPNEFIEMICFCQFDKTISISRGGRKN